jgi:hypothetical protein
LRRLQFGHHGAASARAGDRCGARTVEHRLGATSDGLEKGLRRRRQAGCDDRAAEHGLKARVGDVERRQGIDAAYAMSGVTAKFADNASDHSYFRPMRASAHTSVGARPDYQLRVSSRRRPSLSWTQHRLRCRRCDVRLLVGTLMAGWLSEQSGCLIRSTWCARLTLPSPREGRWWSIGQPRFACAGCATSSTTRHRVSISRTPHLACAATREPFRWPRPPLLRRVAQSGPRERSGTARSESSQIASLADSPCLVRGASVDYHCGLGIRGLGIGVAYPASTVLALNAAPADRTGEAAASLHLSPRSVRCGVAD